MKNLIGKTIQEIRFVDNADEGLIITFTDNTVLQVTERMQAGCIKVQVNGVVAKSEFDLIP